MGIISRYIIFTFISLTTTNALCVSGWSEVESDNSVVKIGGGCTGTRVSNDGYILTARHCFTSCLLTKNSVEEEVLFPEFGWQSPKLYKLNQTAQCDVLVDGVEKTLEIVATGPGFMTPMEQSSLVHFDSDLYEDFLNKSYFHNGDFAIVKERVTESASCKAVSLKELNEGSSVSFIGYPSASTGRPEGRNSNGEDLYKGEGALVSSILENSCISDDAINLNALNLRYDREDLLLSSVDNLPGGSGSSLVNESGEIIGVINSQFRQGVDVYSTYCSGSTVAVKITHVFHLLEEQGFEEQIPEFFNCSQ